MFLSSKNSFFFSDGSFVIISLVSLGVGIILN
jgi:hypothetical protein